MRSSQDGGVIWTGVPTGTYRISAHHPSTRFASFVATCRPGRIVNANPPWGLHELGLPNPARVVGDVGAARRRRGPASLRVRRLPARAVVGGALHRPGVPVPRADAARVRRDARRRTGARPARPPLARRASRSPSRSPRTRFDGTLVRWAVRRRGVPRATTRCVPLGGGAARRVC